MNAVRSSRLPSMVGKFIFFTGFAWLLALAWFGFGAITFALTGLGAASLLAAVAWKGRRRAWRWPALAAGATLVLAVGYIGLRPSNERTWAFDAARTPWAEIAGDTVTLHHYRNFDWHSADAATERWETKTVRLSQLKAVDFGLVYWNNPHLCHTLLTFDFGEDGFVCASIEARREAGESYSPLAGIFRKYELLYVLGDERDVLRVRTNFRKNEVYLFRLLTTPVDARILFLDYLKSANALRAEPAWYHSIATNCTTVIRQHEKLLNVAAPWSWRLVANGHLAGYLYEQGYVSRDLPRAELARRSAITASAQAATAEEFSTAIRKGRPGF